VKKGVAWALRAVGARNPALKKRAIVLAARLAESSDAAEKSLGGNALKEWGKIKPKKRTAPGAD
jgi:3-methyladenine DNA glycosylase AlkD